MGLGGVGVGLWGIKKTLGLKKNGNGITEIEGGIKGGLRVGLSGSEGERMGLGWD